MDTVNEAFVLLDISKKDIEVDSIDATRISKEDREIFFTDAGIPGRWIDDFISIDEWLDYMIPKVSSSNKFSGRRDLLKVCAEFMSLEINKEDLHTINVRKSKDFYKDNLKNIKLNNAKFIINKSKVDRNNTGIEVLTVPFSSKVYVRELNRFVIHPANKKLVTSKCKETAVYSGNTGNVFNLEISKLIDKFVDDRKYITPGKGMNVKQIIHKVINYYRHGTARFDKWAEDNGELLNAVESGDGFVTNTSLIFLKTKAARDGTDIQNLYHCFDIDNKIQLLEQIIFRGTEDRRIKSTLDMLVKYKVNSSEYEKKINILLAHAAKNSRLEQLCKKRYPNYFNPAKKEYTFSRHTSFDISSLPKTIQSSLLSEYNLVKNLEAEIAANKCSHKKDLDILRKSNMDKELWNKFKESYMSSQDTPGGKKTIEYVNCSLCSYPLICPHESEYYSLYFKMIREDSINYIDRINQIITTKYGADSEYNKSREKKQNTSSFCYVCGMEINKELDTDGMNYNESESMYKGDFTGDKLSDDKRIILYAISRNLSFNKPVSRTVVNNITNGIYDSINPVIQVLNKKINSSRKKLKNEADESFMSTSKEINIVVLTIVSIMTLTMKYDFIEFKKNLENREVQASKNKGKRDIIVKKNSVSDRFREAWDIFYSRYKILIDRLGSGKNNIDSLKKLFIKSYDLLKETVGDNIFISESNIASYSTPSVVEEYDSSLWKKGKKSGLYMEYREKSNENFSKYLEEDISSIYMSERKDSPVWKQFEKDCEHTRVLEKTIIQKNILNIMYPYSRLPYSYDRYYKKNLTEWSTDMTVFACPATGKRHSWNTYTFKSGNSIQSFKIKTISSKDSDLEFIKNGKLHSLKCSDCGMDTEELKEKFKNNYSKVVEEKVTRLNDIQSFYSMYKYRCVKAPFHSFKSSRDGYECTSCKMLFSYSSSLDEDFYNKNKEYYIKLLAGTEMKKNEDLLAHKNTNDFTINMNLETGMYSTKADKNILIRSVSESIELVCKEDDSKIKNSMYNLGSSEGLEESEFTNSSLDSDQKLYDMFSKLTDRFRQITIYLGILIKNPYKHKYSSDPEFLDMMSVVNNSSSLEKLINMYEYIVSSKLLDSALAYKVSHSDGVLGAIQYIKLIILHILSNVKSIDIKVGPVVYSFIINRIIDSELLYTKYNYAELKKTYNMNKLTEDSINATDTMDAEELDDSFAGAEAEGFDLFEMSDLSMNNFVDDDIED